MQKGEQMYEGKAKVIFATDNPQQVIQYFKDDATAFNAQKRGTILNKGVINNHVTAILYKLLEEAGVPTHYVDRLTDREMLVKKCDIIPVEVVMRNTIAGSMARRLGKEEGEPLAFPVLEYYYKEDALDDPFINADHVRVFGMATDEEMEEVNRLAYMVNDFLIRYFGGLGIHLVDFKLEFGRYVDENGKTHIILADEITPDTCRLWEVDTQEKLDKDRFRHNMGGVEQAYQRVYKAVCASVS